MPVHFAAARNPTRSPIARALGKREIGRVANDNGDAVLEYDDVLRKALVHFAAHGLGAARTAYDEAKSARAQGDDHGFDRWLGICRTLDRRLAMGLQASQTSAY